MDGIRGLYEIHDKALIQFQVAFIFRGIPQLMRLRQDSPHFDADAYGVWQCLEDDVAIFRFERGSPAQARSSSDPTMKSFA